MPHRREARAGRVRLLGLATIAAAALALALAAGCRLRGRERVVMGTVRLPSMGLVFLAEAEGFFADEGVEVVQRRFTSGKDSLVALDAGEVDAAVSLETPVALRASRDPEIEILTTLHVASRSTRLVARVDRGIARTADLRGKTVGVPLGTNAEYFLHALLAYAGVEGSEVRIVDVAPEAAVDALAGGEVDAIAIWPPHTARARRALGRGALEIEGEVYTEISMLVTRTPVLDARREALRRTLRALSRAERFVRDMPDRAFDQIRKEFPELTDKEVRDEWMRVRPVLGLTHLLATVLEDEADWLRESGRVAGPVLEVGAALSAELLSEVDPEAVTFVSPPRRGTR